MSAGTLYVAIKGDTTDLIKALEKAKKGTIKYGKDAKRSFGTVDKAIGGLKRQVLALGAAWLGARGIGALIKTADTYALLDSKIKLVTKDSEGFSKVYSELFKISQNTGSEFASNAANFSNLSLALKDTNITSEETLGIFEDVNKSLVVAGATTAEASSFMLQFRQAMGSGKLAGDEFRGMMESNSYWGGQLATALGKDVAGLREMSKAGELTTDKLREAFPAMSKQIAEDFANIDKTIARSIVELRNSFGDVIADANRTTGATGSIATSISELATTITENKDTISDLFVAIIKGSEFAVKAVSGIVDAVKTLVIIAATDEATLFEAITGGPDVWKKWLDETESGIIFLRDQLKQVNDQLINVEKVREFEKANDGWTKSAEKNYQSLLRQRKGIEGQIKAAKDAEKQVKHLASVIEEDYVDSWKKSGDAANESNKNVIKYAEKTSAELAAIWGVDEEEYIDSWNKRALAAKESTKNTSDEIVQIKAAEFNEVVQSKRKALGRQEKAEDAYNKRLEGYSDDLGAIWEDAAEDRIRAEEDALMEIATANETVTGEMAKTWERAGQAIQNSFQILVGDFLRGEFDSVGEAADSLFNNILSSFIGMLAQMAVEWGASEVVSWFTGKPSTFSFGGGGGGGGSSVGGIAGGLATSYAQDAAITAASETAIGQQISAGFSTAGASIAEALGFGGTATMGGPAASLAAAEAAAATGTAATGTGVAAGTGTAAGGGAAGGGVAAGAGVAAAALIVVGTVVKLGQWASEQQSLVNEMTDAQVKTADFAAAGVTGRLTELTTATKAALDNVAMGWGHLQNASIDLRDNVLLTATAITTEGGLSDSLEFSMKTMDEATGVWTNQTELFNSMVAQMTELAPATSDAVIATAEMVAEMNGLPSVADELIVAYSDLGMVQASVVDVLGAETAAAAEYVTSIGNRTLSIREATTLENLLTKAQDGTTQSAWRLTEGLEALGLNEQQAAEASRDLIANYGLLASATGEVLTVSQSLGMGLESLAGTVVNAADKAFAAANRGYIQVGFQEFAKGGTPSGLSSHRNSVVSSPTIFPFAQGDAFGLMGEASSEAIMPLTRMGGGDLGVKVNSQQSGPPVVNVYIGEEKINALIDKVTVDKARQGIPATKRAYI